ncbi:Spy/CpxP family protein refolding chaperone [Pseudomonas sp. LRF_L74]|uniref:Spy/CpxP family protein refolding chaperone n=1 Tax=Pseudomonas sp. LRF_L74 TaxID=3369422 RepID=UPI003F614AE4
MRKTLTALFLAATLPTLAMAGAPSDGPRDHGFAEGGPRGEQHGPGDRLFKDLNLTPEQREKIEKLGHERKDDPREITRKYLDKLPEADKQAMKKELETARLEQEKAFKAILTPEQLKKFEEKKKEMEQRRADREEFETWKAQRDKKAQ